MTPAAASSPVAKLALAVVTEPERATPAPVGAREEAMRSLLQTAADAGVRLVACRPQGDQERLLGQAWPFPSPFSVSVRAVALSEGLDRVEARARRSLERMGLPRGDVLLLSGAGDLAGVDRGYRPRSCQSVAGRFIPELIPQFSMPSKMHILG